MTSMLSIWMLGFLFCQRIKHTEFIWTKIGVRFSQTKRDQCLDMRRWGLICRRWETTGMSHSQWIISNRYSEVLKYLKDRMSRPWLANKHMIPVRKNWKARNLKKGRHKIWYWINCNVKLLDYIYFT